MESAPLFRPRARSRCGSTRTTTSTWVADRRTSCALQASLAVEHGFDGVMTSEHHGGFHGYLPNPLQAAGWCLEAMTGGWAAPCPLLLPLPPALVAERRSAWLAACFPGRVGHRRGVGRAALRLPDHARARWTGLAARAFTGRVSRSWGRDARRHPAAGKLADDPAIAVCREAPGARPQRGYGLHRGATCCFALGAGLLFDSLSTPERCGELIDVYREAGGTGPCVMDPAPAGSANRPASGWTTSSTCTAATPVPWPSSTGAVTSSLTPDAGAGDRRGWSRPCTARATCATCVCTCPGVDPAAARAQIRPAGRRRCCPASVRQHPRTVMSRRIHRFEDAEWHVPVAPGPIPTRRPPPDRRRRPTAARAGRRRLLHPGGAHAASPSWRRCTRTTTARCSWCWRGRATSTVSR